MHVLISTVPRVGSSIRGFKGLASNSKRVKGFVQEYLKSPENTGVREKAYSTGRFIYIFVYSFIVYYLLCL